MTRSAMSPLFQLGMLVAILSSGPSASSQVDIAWTQSTRGVSIAADDSNNVFTVDYEQALGAEMVVTKRDVNGALLWTASFDQTDFTKWERAQWIATDSEGSAIVVGTLMSGFSNPVVAASIIEKFDSHGALQWRHVYESGFDGSSTRKCIVDGSNNIYVLGLGFGPSGLVTKVKKFAPNGVTLWNYFDSAGIGAPLNFKFSRDGNIVITGRGIIGSVNGYAKIDTNGNELWSLGGVSSLTVGDIAGDSLGNSYVLHGEFVSNGGTVIRKLGPSGNLIWQKVFGFSGNRIEMGTDDLPIASGYPNTGSFGAAFLKADAAGNTVWQNFDADGPLSLLLHAQLIVDESNDAYLAAGTLFEMAVCKVNSNGTSAWTKTTAGSYANGIALGRYDNSVFVVGGQTARFVDKFDGSWQDLGKGKVGIDGIPLLFAVGDLVPSGAVTLSVVNAAPSSPTFLILGATAVNLPFLGGILVPAPTVVVPGIVTDAAGEWHLPSVLPAVVPPGVDLYLQTWVADTSATLGYSASNALRGTTL